MKKAYQTHPITHEYLSEVEVNESPLERDVYLIPAGAYVDAPPSSKDGYAIVRQGDKWKYIEDNRAAELYSQSGEKYEFTGEYNGLGPVPDWLSTEPPEQEQPPQDLVPWQVSRAQGKAQLIRQGLWPSVINYASSIEDETDRQLADVALNDTTDWQRSSPFLNAAAQALGLTAEQIDDLFIEASQIQL